MKNKYFVALIVLCCMTSVTSCNKDDDDTGIEKTYADDDFLITERNIREKIIGDWEIIELRKYTSGEGWKISNSNDLGINKNVTMRANGECDTPLVINGRYRVSKDSVVISSLWYVASISIGNETTTISMAIGPTYTLKNIEEANTAMEQARKEGWNTWLEQRDHIKFLVKEMKKDVFTLEQADKNTPMRCQLKRR